MKSLALPYLKILLFCSWFGVTNAVYSNLAYEMNRPLLFFSVAVGVLLSVPAIFIQKRLRFYLVPVYLLLLVPSLVQFMYLLLFHRPVVGEFYYPLFEAQPSEITEYAAAHLGWQWLLLPAFAAVPLLLLRFISPLEIRSRQKWVLTGGISVFFFAFFLHFGFDHHSHRIYNYPLDFFESWNDFRSEKKRFAAFLESRQKNSCPVDIKCTLPDTLAQTYVVVIGESASSRHLSLYGYARHTDPELEKIKSELLVFRNVTSPYAHTILCLRTLLTFATRTDSASFYDKPSVLGLFNAAGFDTWWISNQPSLGLFDTEVSVLASEARHTVFVSDSLSAVRKPFDDMLLPQLGKALASSARKKIIFLHLIGSHEEFYLRYPGEYRCFSDSTGIHCKFGLNEEKLFKINSYDNSIRYTDHVLAQIIEQVRKKGGLSYVLYLSDHGEEVYDDRDMCAHAGYDPSPPMFEVPFILWRSSALAVQRPLVLVEHHPTGRKYNTEDLVHTLLDLSSLKSPLGDSTKSILNTSVIGGRLQPYDTE